MNNIILPQGRKIDGNNRLPIVFVHELKHVLGKLTKDELLGDAEKVLLKAKKESANGVLWRQYPEIKFRSKHILEMALAKTICSFNIN